MRKKPTLHLEQLEDRTVPTAYFAKWPDPGHLTLSFAPDGTPAANGVSNFFSKVEPGSTAAAREQIILRAFQTWAQYTNVNISLTGDGGEAFGAAGLMEGDPRFGDIRIGAASLAPSTVATGSPFQPSGGTWSGDVLFNSNYSFGSGSGQYDLFTVALHEAGHVFGLPDQTTDPTSVEYKTYLGPRQGLSAGDIQAVQAQYGVRTPDAFQANGGNHTFATATNLNAIGVTSVSGLVTASGDVTTHQDVEFYRFTTDVAFHPNGITVQLQTARQSLLTGHVTVYNAAGNSVAAAATTDPLSGDLTIHLSQVTPGATYYVGIQGSQANAFGIGAYQLAINLHPSAASVGAPSQFSNAQSLVPLSPTDPNTMGTAGLISAGNDTNVFSFKTQAGPYPNGVNVTLQTWGSGLGDPTLVLFDAAGHQLSSAYSVLPNGTFSLHQATLAANSTYYIRATTPAENSSTHGSYAVQVDLNAPATTKPQVSPILQNMVTNLLGGASNLVGGVSGGLLGSGTLPPPATPLTTVPGYAPQSKYQTVGGLTSPSATNYYSIYAAPAAAGQTDVMTVSLLAQYADTLSPQVQVFDSGMHIVNATVLANADGVVVVQIANAMPNASYYIQVSAAPRPNKTNTGAYFLDVTFGGTAAPASQAFGGNTLSAAAPAVTQALTISQNALFSFVLSANTGTSAPAAEVQMVIYDANGNQVYSQIAYANQQATTGTVYLQAGNYTVRYVAVPKTPGQLSPLSFNLSGWVLSDPMGPQPAYPSSSPSSSPPPASGTPPSGYSSSSTYSSSTSYPPSSGYTYQ